MPHKRALLVVAAVLLAACTPPPASTPTPSTPAPSPTFTCTPVAGGTPSPCSGDEYEASQQQELLYQQAESVGRALVAEQNRVFQAGEPMSDLIRDLTTGQAREVARLAHDLLGDGTPTRLRGGDYSIASLERVPAGLGHVAAFRACIDQSDGTYFVGDAVVQVSEESFSIWEFVIEDSQIKLTSSLSIGEGDTCDA